MSKADARRLRALIEPHLEPLFRAAFRLCMSRADAEDLVQDTCVRAYLRIGELRETRAVLGWLLRIQHNLFIDATRRAQRAPTASADDEDRLAASASMEPNPEELTELGQREEQLQRAWLKLDRGHRALLALSAEGYTSFEIAEIAGLAVEVVNSRLYRARRRFAQYLTEEQLLPAHGIVREIAK